MPSAAKSSVPVRIKSVIVFAVLGAVQSSCAPAVVKPPLRIVSFCPHSTREFQVAAIRRIVGNMSPGGLNSILWRTEFVVPATAASHGVLAYWNDLAVPIPYSAVRQGLDREFYHIRTAAVTNLRHEPNQRTVYLQSNKAPYRWSHELSRDMEPTCGEKLLREKRNPLSSD